MKYSIFILSVFILGVGCDRSDDTVGGSGIIETEETVVSAETAGRVENLFFDEGTVVEVGDTLALIDPSRLELQLASLEAGRKVAEANLITGRIQVEQAGQTEAYARSEFDRVARLLESGTTTQKQYDQLEHEYTQAALARRTAEANIGTIEAELQKIDTEINRLRRSLSDCHPLAPIAGIITERYVNTGELLNVGKPIAKIAQLDTVWVKVYLPTGDFANITLGTHATVSTESGFRQYEGVVTWTSQEAEFTPKNIQTKESRAGLVYAVKLRIPNIDGRLKIGMPVFVTLTK